MICYQEIRLILILQLLQSLRVSSRTWAEGKCIPLSSFSFFYTRFVEPTYFKSHQWLFGRWSRMSCGQKAGRIDVPVTIRRCSGPGIVCLLCLTWVAFSENWGSAPTFRFLLSWVEPKERNIPEWHWRRLVWLVEMYWNRPKRRLGSFCETLYHTECEQTWSLITCATLPLAVL